MYTLLCLTRACRARTHHRTFICLLPSLLRSSVAAVARAGARAIDATAQFMYESYGGKQQIKKWIVAGASKRGATTWLVGSAYHDHIVGIAPMVFDLLNFKMGVQHMWQALGGW